LYPLEPEMTETDPSHFYEVAFVGLGTLEAICFGVHGLLFTVYSQYMSALSLPDNPDPPPATGEIVWICRCLTVVIVLAAVAAIPPLYVLPIPESPLAEAVRAVLALILVSLAATAFAIVYRMKVPQRRG
jgi:hypothetical protein